VALRLFSINLKFRDTSGRLSSLSRDDGELSSAVKTNYVTPIRLGLLRPPASALVSRRRRQEPLGIFLPNIDHPFHATTPTPL
jgi:hypothetical protein